MWCFWTFKSESCLPLKSRLLYRFTQNIFSRTPAYNARFYKRYSLSIALLLNWGTKKICSLTFSKHVNSRLIYEKKFLIFKEANTTWFSKNNDKSSSEKYYSIISDKKLYSGKLPYKIWIYLLFILSVIL